MLVHQSGTDGDLIGRYGAQAGAASPDWGALCEEPKLHAHA